MESIFLAKKFVSSIKFCQYKILYVLFLCSFIFLLDLACIHEFSYFSEFPALLFSKKTLIIIGQKIFPNYLPIERYLLFSFLVLKKKFWPEFSEIMNIIKCFSTFDIFFKSANESFVSKTQGIQKDGSYIEG